jgi:hypothetical protein
MATILRIASGVIVWALHFGVLYGFTALACARGFQHLVPAAVGAASVLAALAAVAIVVRNLSSEFDRWLAAAIALAALVGILWEGVTVFMVPMCE